MDRPGHIHDNFSNLAQRQVLLATRTRSPSTTTSHAAGQVGTAYACWELDSNPGVLQATCRSPCPNNAAKRGVHRRSSRSAKHASWAARISIAKSGSVVVAYFDLRQQQAMFVALRRSWPDLDHAAIGGDCEPAPVAPSPGQASATSRCPAWRTRPATTACTWSGLTTPPTATVKDADILFSRSSTVGNAGVLTWTTPVRCSTRTGSGMAKDQFQPAIAITESGSSQRQLLRSAQ